MNIPAPPNFLGPLCNPSLPFLNVFMKAKEVISTKIPPSKKERIVCLPAHFPHYQSCPGTVNSPTQPRCIQKVFTGLIVPELGSISQGHEKLKDSLCSPYKSLVLWQWLK